jgi:sulfate adenylyltransferase
VGRHTVAPHGGALVDLVVQRSRRAELRDSALAWPSWRLTPRQLCDLELLATGGFSPLRGFLGSDDYAAVCESMRLADGTLWPIPITLDLPESVVRAAERSGTLALRDREGAMVAAFHLTQAWQPDLRAEAAAVFGTTNEAHPSVEYLLHRTNPWYAAGELEVLEPFSHPDFPELRRTPAQLRSEFERIGWKRVVAFNTRNPMHRVHLELTVRGAREADAKLLIHPVVGLTQPGDIDAYTRVRCYQALLPSYPAGTTMLSLLPLAMRMGGPREALWHTLIRKNHGATHFIVGRDHAGPRPDRTGVPFYHPYAAQELLERHEAELGVQVVRFRKMVYLATADTYVEEHEAPVGLPVLQISGTDLRARLAQGAELPEWFTVPAVARELRRRHRARADQGFTVFLTGLSGSGKSTIANSLVAKLRDLMDRSVSLLDGDEVRQRLSSELGFSREDRDRHVLRIGYVASEITRSGGVAVCAPIAPYEATRAEVRRLVEAGGGFLLVHVDTPLAVCEERDRKGLYAKARAGLVPQFTGVSDPYEEPTDADVVVNTSTQTPDEASQRIIEQLQSMGYLSSTQTAARAPLQPPHATQGSYQSVSG